MKKITSSLVALALVVMATNNSSAQDYTYSTFNAPFQYLTNPDTLSIDVPDWDDDGFFVSTGFPVNIMGNVYDSVAVETNGSLIFYNTTDQLMNGVDTLPIFMPFGEFLSNSGSIDLRYRTVGNSPIGFETTGAPGARIAKFEWRNAGFYNDPNGFVDSVNFQAWIYEGSGDVEFRYGTSMVNPISYDGATGPSVGIGPFDINNSNFLAGYYLTGDSTSATLSNTYGSLTGTPTNGTVFRFANNLTIGLSTEEALEISVYPNPASGNVHLRFHAKEETHIAISDLTGHVLVEEVVSASGDTALKMDISALASGIYMISANGIPTGEKLVIK